MKTGVWNRKQVETQCAITGCDNIFLLKPHTNRKYCDSCADLTREAKREARRKAKAKLPIVNHEDCCGCGGCCGVESRRG